MNSSLPSGVSRLALRLTAAVFTWGVASLAHAQTATANSADPKNDETVNLPKFEITASETNPYQSQQALSSSRIAMAIQDVPQTISVVPKELIEDSLSGRMLDAAKYVTPIVESTLPFGGDRYQIRGFQVSQEFIDGSVISGADGYSMSQAPYNIERIEVIKGPNAILVPGGSPGGVMNPITKSPIMKNQGTVNLELAEYFGNSFNFDVNRVISQEKGMAARLVFAIWRNDYYIKNQTRNGYELSPSFSFQLSPTQKLTIKADFVQNRETNLGGVPLDPSVGTNGTAMIARGLPRNWSFGNDADNRHRSTDRISAELLSTLGEHVTSRLYIMADEVRRIDVGGTSASISNGGGGSRNPFTGNYEPGVNWNTAAYNNDTTGTVALTGTAVPVTDPSTWVYTRNNGKVDLKYTEGHVKNDYATTFQTPWFKSTTITGFSANTSKVHYLSYAPAPRSNVANNNLAAITYENYNFAAIKPGLTTAALGTDKTARQNDLQLYIFETLGLLQDRIQVSGGLSRFWGDVTRTDSTGTAIDPTLLTTTPSYDLSDTAKSFGVSVKPIKQVSLFYGYNTTGGTLPSTLAAGANAPSLKVASGQQREFGVKVNMMDGKITASVAHFNIEQQNYPVPNSDYYALVAAGRFTDAASLQNPLYLNLTSKGYEGELTYSWNRNLTLLANYSAYEVRQPITNVRLRGVPDHIAGLYADYRFTQGVLNGFGVNVGVDYKSDVAGENATGYTTTRPLPGAVAFVPNQPSFYVAGRTLTNLGFSYRYQNWTARIGITNLFDKDYILAAGSRTSVVVGDPRAWKSSFSYRF
jgi:iron complex outermembrane receptor protein